LLGDKLFAFDSFLQTRFFSLPVLLRALVNLGYSFLVFVRAGLEESYDQVFSNVLARAHPKPKEQDNISARTRN
jgi:hypothetical protein